MRGYSDLVYHDLTPGIRCHIMPRRTSIPGQMNKPVILPVKVHLLRVQTRSERIWFRISPPCPLVRYRPTSISLFCVFVPRKIWADLFPRHPTIPRTDHVIRCGK